MTLPTYLDPDGNPEEWHAYAECIGVDPELFFPVRGESARQAKAVCAECVVRAECLAYALDNVEQFGVWGGLSERERKRIRSERAHAPRPCVQCGVMFTPNVANKAVCSAACRKARPHRLQVVS